MTTRITKTTAVLAAVGACAAAALAAGEPATGAQGKAKAKQVKLLTGVYKGGAFNRYSQLVSVRLGSTRKRATQTVTLTAGCPALGRTVVDTLTVRRMIVRGGTARFEAPFREQVAANVPAVGGLTRTGVVDGQLRFDRQGRVTGRVRTRFRLFDATNRLVARCDSGEARWQGRLRTGKPGEVERGKPAPEPGATYLGATSQKRPFILSMGKGGKSIEHAAMSFDISCSSALGRPLELSTARVPVIRKGKRRGRFTRSGTFTRTIADPTLGVIREVYRWRLVGRFGPETVGGRWRVSADTLDAETGEELGGCALSSDRFRAVR